MPPTLDGPSPVERGTQAQDRNIAGIASGIIVLISGSLLAWLLRYGTAVVLPGFQADFGTDPAAIGALAAAYFWPYAAMQPFAGLQAELWGARFALAFWLAIAALGTLLFALAPNYPVALIGRALGGAGVGIVLVVAFILLAQWFGDRHFGTIAGLFVATGPIGGLLAAHPLRALAETFGWRNTFVIVSVWLLLTAIGAALLLPGRSARPSGKRVSEVFRGLIRAARLPNLWLCAVHAFVALGILSTMQGLWTLPFLDVAYSMSPEAGAHVLQAWSIGLLVALPAWGYIADRLLRSNKRAMLASIALHVLPWVWLCMSPSAWPMENLFPLFLFIALMNGCWMPAYALVNRTAPPEARGGALGLMNLAFFLGAACFQQFSGILIGWFSADAAAAPLEAYRWLFAGFVVTLMLSAVAVLWTRDRPHCAD